MVYENYRKAFAALCILVILVSMALGFGTSLRAGPAWDDPTELQVFNGFLELASQPELSYEAGKDKIDRLSPGSGFYGVLPQYVAHVWDVVVDGGPWSKLVDTNVQVIARRHAVSLLFVICAAIGIFVTFAVVARDLLPAFAGVAVLLSTPVFLGLSSIDPKDGPVAAGVTLFSCGCALLLWQVRPSAGDIPQSVKNWRVNTIAGLAIFFGTAITIGTRAGTAALLAVEGTLVCMAIAIETLVNSRAKTMILPLGILLLTACGGAILTIICNPLAPRAPIQWVIDSIAFAAHFPTLCAAIAALRSNYPLKCDPVVVHSWLGNCRVSHDIRAAASDRRIRDAVSMFQYAVLGMLVALASVRHTRTYFTDMHRRFGGSALRPS